jgi:hypothetical protein
VELVSEPLELPPSGVVGRKRAARLSRDGGDRVTIAADATSMTTSHPREFLTMTPMRTTPPGPASDMGSTMPEMMVEGLGSMKDEETEVDAEAKVELVRVTNW